MTERWKQPGEISHYNSPRLKNQQITYALQSSPESSANSEQAGNGLPIPEITQREEPAPEPVLSKEEFAMKAQFKHGERVWSYWDLTGFGLNVSPSSDICRLNNCEFEIDEGRLRPDFTGG